MSSTPSLANRIRGSFLGLAICDALGAPAEFQVRGCFPSITSMQANLNFNLGPGFFTDDTSMALCLAHSLLEHGPISDSVDQARKYLAWYRTGYQSSLGRCFDIGNLTRDALGVWKHAVLVNDKYGKNGPSPDATKDQAAIHDALATIDERFNQDRYCGNGSLMRVLPVALFFSSDLPTAANIAAESSRVSHPHMRCVLSCALYTILVAHSLQDPNVTKETLVGRLSDFLSAVKKATDRSTSKSKVKSTGISSFLERFDPYTSVASFHDKHITQIRSSGYVLDSLEAALWALFTTSSFRGGAIKVVDLGDDADTVGAIYGGLAGAVYGDGELPKEWLQDMQSLDLVENAVGDIIMMRLKEVTKREDAHRDGREEIRASVRELGL